MSMVAAGCTSTLDNKDLETKIGDDLKTRGVGVKSIACPEGKQKKVGVDFDCTLTTDDGKTTTTAVQQVADGTLSWDTKNLMTTKAITDALSKSNPGADVKCPTKALFIGKEGDKFDCTVAAKPFEVVVGKDGMFNAKPKGGASSEHHE